MRFEDLERDPEGQLARLYEALGLGGFDALRPLLRAYLGSIDGYAKNTLTPLPGAVRERVAQAWRRNFEEWGYAS